MKRAANSAKIRGSDTQSNYEIKRYPKPRVCGNHCSITFGTAKFSKREAAVKSHFSKNIFSYPFSAVPHLQTLSPENKNHLSGQNSVRNCAEFEKTAKVLN